MKLLLPYMYPTIMRNKLQDTKTVLDLGCGKGEFMKMINFDKKFDVTGVELFEPYIKEAKKTGLFRKIIKSDLRNIKISSKSYDAVILNQVIEHLTKKDALKLLKELEVYAKKSIIIGTPNGHYHQEEYDDNELQTHLSHWRAKDFKKLGYSVHGQGLKLVYGENGITNIQTNSIVKLFWYIISYFMSPLVYYNPEIAAYIIAVKKSRSN